MKAAMPLDADQMRLDVVVLTRNSELTLEACLDSIYENVPTNRIIVVDGFSTDRTLEIIQNYNERCRNIVTIFDGGTRATGRQKGIESVSTEWFMFVDSDVILCERWFEKAKELIAPTVGGIWGMNFDLTRKVSREKLRKLQRQISFSDFQFEQFEVRGGCHDILIRAKAIEGIKIPCDLNVYEDAYIKRYIERKGWKVLATKDPFCIHDRSGCHHHLYEIIERILLEAKHGPSIHDKSSYSLRNMLWAPYKAVSIYMKSRNTEAAKEHLQMYYYMFIGSLVAKARRRKHVQHLV